MPKISKKALTGYIRNFFVIIVEDDVLNILVEFEGDRISPRESAENGQIGAQRLNCKIFVSSVPILSFLIKFEFY